MQKSSYEEVANIFLEGGCLLISKDYRNNQSLLEYRCECGNLAKIRLSDFKRGKRCRMCGHKRTTEKLKYSYAYVKGYFESYGCKLLSNEYRNNHEKLSFICSCGSQGVVKFKSFRTGVRCNKCSLLKRSGANHPRWNPNKTDEERTLGRYASGPIRWWSNNVKKRDRYICQVCGNSEKPVVAHHLESYDENIDLRFELNNGITLCSDCHRDFHSTYGYKGNTEIQMKSYRLLKQEEVSGISERLRILSFDTSMSRPGSCALEIRNGHPQIIDVSHVATTSSQPHGLRAEIIDAWAVSFIAKHCAKPFDVIVREDFVGRTSKQAHPVYSAWGSCDRALNKFGLNFTTPAISQSAVKKAVVGKGKAEKDEVAVAVRKWTGYTGEFAVDDESDACAIGLAYAIQNGLIKTEE